VTIDFDLYLESYFSILVRYDPTTPAVTNIDTNIDLSCRECWWQHAWLCSTV